MKISWKEGKDLTNGETDRVWEEHNRKVSQAGNMGKGKGKAAPEKTRAQGKTVEERVGGGEPSFFTWFAWVGRGRDGPAEEGPAEEDSAGAETDDVFDHGDELALTIADELYPNAVKFYSMRW